MRSLLMAAFATAGLALAATSGVSAAPIAPIGKGAEVIDSRAVVYYYHRHRIIIAAAGGTTVTATAAGGETRGKSGGRCTFRRAAAEREFFLGAAITGNSAERCGLTSALQLYLGIGSASFSYTRRLPTYAGANVGARTSFATVNKL